jgi:hypothetical protein
MQYSFPKGHCIHNDWGQGASTIILIGQCFSKDLQSLILTGYFDHLLMLQIYITQTQYTLRLHNIISMRGDVARDTIC